MGKYPIPVCFKLDQQLSIAPLTPSFFSIIGMAYVADYEGELSADDAIAILEKAREADTRSVSRILVKGNAVITLEAAEVFAEAGILLFGNESQTVGPEDAPIHLGGADGAPCRAVLIEVGDLKMSSFI